jgi:hypothetical protein
MMYLGLMSINLDVGCTKLFSFYYFLSYATLIF